MSKLITPAVLRTMQTLARTHPRPLPISNVSLDPAPWVHTKVADKLTSKGLALIDDKTARTIRLTPEGLEFAKRLEGLSPKPPIQLKVGEQVAISGYRGDGKTRLVEVVKTDEAHALCKCLVRSTADSPVFRSYFFHEIDGIMPVRGLEKIR